MTQLVPAVDLSYLYLSGLNVSVASNTTLSIAAGQCRDSNNVIDMVVSTALTLNAAVNGANGLDTGTFAASTMYYVWLIGDSSAFLTPASLLSLSATAPTLPTGYDSQRLIGCALSDGSTHFLTMYMTGSGKLKECYWDAAISVLAGGSATSLTAVDLSSAVPALDNLPVLLSVSFTPATAADKVSIAPGGSTSTSLPAVSSVVAAKAQIAPMKVLSKLVSSVPKISYINSASSGATTILVYGFELNL
jgi:hypothetical protein